MPKYTNENTGSKIKFYALISGKFATKVDTGTQGSVQRENKNGDSVTELVYTSLAGQLVGLSKRESEYGDQLVLELQDKEEKMVIQVKLYSGIALSILKRLPNVKSGEQLVLSAWTSPSQDGRKMFNNITCRIASTQGKGMLDAFKDDAKAPTKEQIENAEGKLQWSYKKAVDYCFTICQTALQSTIEYNKVMYAGANEPEPDVDIEQDADFYEGVPMPTEEPAPADDLPF